jgi:hypothetical protein
LIYNLNIEFEGECIMGKLTKLSVLVILLILVMLLGSCFLITGLEQESETVNTPAPTTIVINETESPQENRAEIESAMLDTLNTIFADTATVYFTGDMGYIVVPEGGQQFADEVQMAKLGNSEYLSEWESITSMVKMMSETMYHSLPGYALSLVNPVDTTLSLYTVIDGDVIYDVMKD